MIVRFFKVTRRDGDRSKDLVFRNVHRIVSSNGNVSGFDEFNTVIFDAGVLPGSHVIADAYVFWKPYVKRRTKYLYMEVLNEGS